MQQKRILVIDDEEMHLYTAQGLLESEGYQVSTYRGSFGATNQVKSLQPDLILLDINMPALSGENLIGLIKPHCREKNIPILFYSSNDEAGRGGAFSEGEGVPGAAGGVSCWQRFT